MGSVADYIDAYELAEWIAEDYRLIKDSESIYPHAYAYMHDLADPISAARRREKLKEAFGW